MTKAELPTIETPVAPSVETTPAHAAPESLGKAHATACCSFVKFGRVAAVIGAVLVIAFIAVRMNWSASSAEDLTEQLNRSHLAARASAATIDLTPRDGEAHPLDPALAQARQGLERIERDVIDYTARIIKRERNGNRLGDEQQMVAKIRSRKLNDGELVAPMSVYLKFVEPRSVAGREVIWVEGQNDGKMIAHEGGLLNFVRASLNPDGPIAMLGQRYPIYKIGIQNLIEELLLKGERDRELGLCEVNIIDGQDVAGRSARMIEVIHHDRRPEYDFHIARIYIDEELELPIRYASWGWPEQAGGEPMLLEEYTYADLAVNVGLSDSDFDPDNPEYKFP